MPLSSMSKQRRSFRISTAVLHAAVTSETVSILSRSDGSVFSVLIVIAVTSAGEGAGARAGAETQYIQDAQEASLLRVVRLL